MRPFLAALLLCCCQLAARSEPSSSVDPELTAARDRIMTSLFFRGEVADLVLGAGAEKGLPGYEPGETYAESRESMIFWLAKRPEEGARLYMHLKNRGPGAPAGPLSSEIRYSMPSWKFNPAFKKMVKDLSEAARQGGESEYLSMAALRLFEGPIAPPEAMAPEVRMGPGGPASAPAAAPAGLFNADHVLDRAALSRENALLGGWLDSARRGYASASSGRGGVFLKKAGEAYAGFSVTAAGLAGRRRVTSAEAAALEASRREARRWLYALSAAESAFRVGAAAGSPGLSGGVFAAGEKARAEIESALAGFEDPGADHRGLSALAAAAAAEWGALAAPELLRAYMTRKAAGGGFSCAWDYLDFALSRLLRPGDPYVSARETLLGAAGPSAETTEKLQAALALAPAASEANCRAQLVFWDWFANPFPVSRGPEGWRFSWSGSRLKLGSKAAGR